MFGHKKPRRLTAVLHAATLGAAAVALLAGAVIARPAWADMSRAVTASFAPLTDESSPDKKGLVYDLVLEMMKLQKIDKAIEFMPWGDAMKIVASEKGAIAFPMTRSPEREDKFKWLVKVFDMNRSFAGRPDRPAVNTIEEAKAVQAVGTTSPSASLNYLKAKGLTNIVEFPSSRELMQALSDGKIDIAYQPVPFAKADWKLVGGKGALAFGAVQEVSAAYLAANKDSPLKPDDWQGALQVLEQEGTFDSLMKKYGME